MKYFEWQTDYELYCKKHSSGMFDEELDINRTLYQIALGMPISKTKKKQKPPKYEEFYPIRKREIIQAGSPPIRLECEHHWIRCRKPFYSVHPKITPQLCKVNLNKIPSNLVKMPGDLKAVHIRFSQAHEEFVLREEIKSNNKRGGHVPAGSFVRGFLMVDNRNVDGSGHIAFIFDMGVTIDYGNQKHPIYPVFGLSSNEGESLAESISQNRRSDRPPSYNDIIENTMKLAVTVGFLSDNPAICKEDVLANDRARFEVASEEEKQIIINRAHRKGKVGFTIGSDEMFTSESKKSSDQSFGEGSGLKFAHIRGGHPRAVRYGTGLSKVKIEWIQPTVVRDDLPFKDSK